MVEVVSDLVTQVMELAIPIAVVIELSNILISSFLRVAFGGKLWFGR